MKDNNVLLMRGLKKEMNHGEVHDDSIKAEEKKNPGQNKAGLVVIA